MDAERIVLRSRCDRSQPTLDIDENLHDAYQFSVPICPGDARLECDGTLVHDGPVRPGMLRVVSPGERFSVLRRARGAAAILSIPGPWLRQRVTESDRGGW
ncbi:hypothetical protein [Marinivivus vitaminiproducens]|uniref:hypothetical protein n=1 Tax=Marinivivus vitaminiproducens TaxID=3035935 RepID=UPI0027A1F5FE|nr:hypothetical protein P4R82_04810 [Geminicoccaceae bacterium SCSIO 64248]